MERGEGGWSVNSPNRSDAPFVGWVWVSFGGDLSAAVGVALRRMEWSGAGSNRRPLVLEFPEAHVGWCRLVPSGVVAYGFQRIVVSSSDV